MEYGILECDIDHIAPVGADAPGGIMPATNKDILDKLEENATALAVMNERLKVLDEHHKTLYGNGQPGLVKDVDRINTTGRVAISLLGIAVAVLSAMQALTGCAPVSSPQQTAAAYNATYAAGTATANAIFVPTPEYNPTMTPTATETPQPTDTPTPTLTAWAPIEVTPCGQAICVLPDQDEDVLARLCVAEVRGFGDKRRIACLSVISTVLTRMVTRLYSDGTVEGTIKWGCGPETQACAFPRYIVDGCEGIIPSACPWAYPDSIAYFQGVARDALDGEWGGTSGVCRGYLYYGSRDLDMMPDACIITSQNGLEKEGFHN